jgi:ABC-type Zn uptake system ZnuABC Zn-binding protein ZnuA
MLSRRSFLRALPLLSGAIVGCEQEPPPPRHLYPDAPIQVITSTAQAADLIRHIGGKAVTVHSLIPPEQNPNLWQPMAADLVTLQLADVFFLSGLGLESLFAKDLDKLRSRGIRFGVLADELLDTDILLRPDGKQDPHFWMDPRLWAKAATGATRILCEAAPPSTNLFQDRAHQFTIELEKIHRSVLKQMDTLSPEKRFAFASHDSMAYFGRAYDLEFRSLCNAEGVIPGKLPSDLNTWLTDKHIHHFFRDQSTRRQDYKEVLAPLTLSEDHIILSLSLAKAGTVFAGTASELAVDAYLPALQYTADLIAGRLALE